MDERAEQHIRRGLKLLALARDELELARGIIEYADEDDEEDEDEADAVQAAEDQINDLRDEVAAQITADLGEIDAEDSLVVLDADDTRLIPGKD